MNWLINQAFFTLRILTHLMRMKHIEKGRDWKFYENHSVKDILKMKLDGTEESKIWDWTHKLPY